MKPEGKALRLIADRLGALAHEPDDELADRTWMIAVPEETSGKTQAAAGALKLLARDAKGCPMGEAAPVADISAEVFARELRALLPKADAGAGSLQKLFREESVLIEELLGARITREGAQDEKLPGFTAALPEISPEVWRDSPGRLEAVLEDLRQAIEESDKAFDQENTEASEDPRVGRALVLDHLLLMLLLSRTIASGDYLPGMRASAEAVRRAVVWAARKKGSSREDELLTNLRRAEALIDERVLAGGRMTRRIVRLSDDGGIRFGSA